MSEFVECQTCGRSFFAENLVCPYCGGGAGDDEADNDPLLREAARIVGGPEGGGLHGFLFALFQVLLAGIAIYALYALGRPRAPRAFLVFEAAAAIVVLVGLALRRRWGRVLAIFFILGHAVLGTGAILGGGAGSTFVWGPGPLALLLFLLPFASRQARERFDR